jgi:hypothetical protein
MTERSVLRMRTVGANAAPAITGTDELPGKVNYFFGNDPRKWHANVATFRRVAYTGVYKGIDLVYHGSAAGSLEYDFVVRPGGDPSRIKLAFTGAKSMRIAANGDLLLGLDGGAVTWRKPTVYQVDAGGSRRGVDGAYVAEGGDVRFRVARYDAARPLVIDPSLEYSTYLGGSGTAYGGDSANSIAVDSTGHVFVAGVAYSTNFPVTASPFQKTNGAYAMRSSNAFVTEFTPSGAQLVYSTYLGGSGNEIQYDGGAQYQGDSANGIAVDNAGYAFVAGETGSADFPVTPSAFQRTNKAYSNGGSNAFVTELTPSGSELVYSTYLGGSGAYSTFYSDSASSIAVDGSGHVFVAGRTNSADFPVTGSAFQKTNKAVANGASNGFVTELAATGSKLVYSTYLGGSDADGANGVAVDSSDRAFVAGGTGSADFPVTPSAYQKTNKAFSKHEANGFVTELAASGSQLVYSSYLGGSIDDFANSIALNSTENAFAAGPTRSADFPLTVSPFQKTNRGYANYDSNAFMTEFAMSPTPPAPTVAKVAPSAGPVAGGTTVAITGTAFASGATVKFGTVAATNVAVSSATAITCKSPKESAGTVNVTVTTPGGTSADTAADKFAYK